MIDLDLPKRYMIVDVSNLLHRTFYVHAKEPLDDLIGLAYKSTFITLNKYYNDLRPDVVVLAFDGKNNWRKVYTASGLCISSRAYKGTRRQNLTPSQRERYELYLKFVDDFEDLLRTHTSIVCMKGEGLEADDIISAFVEMYALNEKNMVTIISQDRDLYQLLKNESVQIIDPASKEIITNKKIDADFFLFEKLFRGDQSDNVQNAYPGIHKTTIEKAFVDSYTKTNLMKHKWTDINDKTYLVEDLFEENRLLMDLSQQPDYIRERMFEVVKKSFQERSKYSHFHFLGFVGKYNLREVSKKMEYLIPLLSS